MAGYRPGDPKLWFSGLEVNRRYVLALLKAEDVLRHESLAGLGNSQRVGLGGGRVHGKGPQAMAVGVSFSPTRLALRSQSHLGTDEPDTKRGSVRFHLIRIPV